ncbi:MAG TPA: GDP-mannose 4,6-dehydratase [Pseudomonadota bacterium]|nr:GDP-mannose 4,6-dehydratase [Pseudomonadota bacterium]
MKTRRALITGITGQDGSYLAEFLLRKGYEVHGIVRRSSSFNTARIDGIYQDPHTPDCQLRLHYGDMLDATVLSRILHEVAPDEVYNLAAQSHVRVSFDMPEHTLDVVALGTARLLEVLRTLPSKPRFYQASSSEMFGGSAPPQSETTPFRPCSPYAVAKIAAYHLTVLYRDAYGLFACNGILFNHESPRRSETFVTRKVTRAAARIKLGLQDKLFLGNLEARRDWGFAGDFVEAMWLLLQQEQPTDVVICTGESHSVRDLLDVAFSRLNLDWQRYVEIDPRYFRPSEVDELRGDMTWARKLLKWEPKVRFRQLVEMMVDHDLADLLRNRQKPR